MAAMLGSMAGASAAVAAVAGRGAGAETSSCLRMGGGQVKRSGISNREAWQTDACGSGTELGAAATATAAERQQRCSGGCSVAAAMAASCRCALSQRRSAFLPAHVEAPA